MPSGASSAAATAAAIAIFAIMVLPSLGNQETRPLCSISCGSLCTINCTDQIFNTCRSYCANPLGARQSCERQVFLDCTVKFCCNSTCSSDCILEAKNSCQFVPDTTIDCQSCRDGILQYCPPTCYNDCSNTCVKK